MVDVFGLEHCSNKVESHGNMDVTVTELHDGKIEEVAPSLGSPAYRTNPPDKRITNISSTVDRRKK